MKPIKVCTFLGPAIWTCMQSFKKAAHVSVLEVVAFFVLLKWICSLPMTFSTSMLCKQRDTTFLKQFFKCCCNACAWNICYNFVVRRVHLELRNKCVSPSLPAACVLPCKPSYPNGAPLYCSNMWHAFYLATQHHVYCVHPSGKLAADSGRRPSLSPSWCL